MKGTGAKPANVQEIMTQHFDPADEHDVLDPERLATPSGVAAVLSARPGAAQGLGQNFLVDRNVFAAHHRRRGSLLKTPSSRSAPGWAC